MFDVNLFTNNLGRIQKPPKMSAVQKKAFDELMASEQYPSEWSFKDRVEFIKSGRTEIPTCDTCGGLVHYKQHIHDFPHHCSRICASRSDKAVKARSKFHEQNPDKNIYALTMRKYGKPAMQVDEIKAKSVASRSKHTDVLTPEWFLEHYTNSDKTQYDLTNEFGIPQPSISEYMTRLNIPSKSYSINRSSVEQRVCDFLTSIGVEFEVNRRNIIHPQEIDIFIPSYNLAIEVNGLYWHSNEFTDDFYHLNKMKRCKDVGIQLIQFWDSEIIERFPVVCSMIRSRVGLSEIKIGARKLVCSLVSPQAADKFFKENHLKGHVRAQQYIGLFQDDVLISCMSLSKSRWIKDGSWEIIRFASKLNHTVVGALSKLLKFSGHSHIITYVDLMIGNGSSYAKAGFKEIRTSPPCAWYFKQNSNILYHRILVQKHKLKELLPLFDENKTAHGNLSANKWMWVHDVGNAVFEFRKD